MLRSIGAYLYATESARLEDSKHLVEKSRAHEIGRDYLENKRQEMTESPIRGYEIESSPLGTEIESETVISKLMPTMGEMKLEPTVESAEAIVHDPNDVEIDAALKAPELYESYEFPMKDMESLLSEIDALSLEPETKADRKLESMEDADGPL